METLKTIYVNLVEGAHSLVPFEGKYIRDSMYSIVNNGIFDPLDNSSLFEFVPGDIVLCTMESRFDYMNNIEHVLVAKSLISSDMPNRNLYMLKFIIANQNGLLSKEQLAIFEKDIAKLKEDMLEHGTSFYHPNIVRWLHKQ